VKLLDANLLIYGVNRDAPLHRKAKTWLEGAIEGPETVAFSWNVLLAFLRLAFLRITTRAGLFQKPLTVPGAFALIDSWLEQPAVTVIHPGPRHQRILRDLLTAAGTGGKLVSDAHLAALAIEHGAELCSTDRDFARLAGLHWRNPLEQ
jgi:hypothetical protein